MPPGRYGGGRAMMGASMAGIMNADVTCDEDARKRTKKVFGTILGILYVLDIGCSFSVLWIQCLNLEHANEEHDDSSTTTGQCLQQSIRYGFTFSPMGRSTSTSIVAEFGDLFWLALLRCIVTTILLGIGIYYGKQSKSSSSSSSLLEASSSSEEEEVVATTTTPATSHEEEASSSNGGGSRPIPTSTSTLTQPLLLEQEQDDDDHDDTFTDEAEAQAPQVSSRFCCGGITTSRKRLVVLSSLQIKNVIFLCLFLSSTMYQVYAGLKVSTYDHPSHTTRIITPLLCLTVLWINAQAYIFRTLLSELTRENSLFLPSQIHRHPMYYEHGRALSIHWCDLCRQRIGGTSTTAGNGSNTGSGCYRCALCDFDICMKCANRTDAATVGENVLRGDRGVRTETAITTTGYISRSMMVAKSELPLLLISFLLLGGSSISRLLLPHFQGHIIDKVIPTTSEDGTPGHYDKDGFYYYIRIYIWIMIIQGAISTLYSAIFTLVSRRLKFTIRNSLLDKILIQDVAYFDGTESGRLISRLTNDLDLMMSPIQSSLSSLLSNVLILFGGMIMCFIKSYRLSMLAFVTVGPISYLWEQYAHWSKGLAREMLSYWAEGNSIASQALSHIRTVKAFGCEDKVLQKYTETNQQALHCGVKDAWGNGITSALTGYLDLGSGVLILYFGGLLVYQNELSVGELVTFQLFWNMMNNAYQNLQGLVTSFTRSAAGAEKVFSLWDSTPDIDPTQGDDIIVENVQGSIQLENVTFYYQMRPDNIVLKQFNLSIPAGKTIALVGRSGGGKSTIINLLLRFYDPREGQILLDGKGYDSLKVHQLRRLFGVVTQETELFALTVEENIAYGLDKNDYTMEDVVNAAKKAFAHDFIVEMKDGYQTRIGERGNRLSGGQRQRLAIARVFLRRPKIILLDEATSALDENSQEAVQQALGNLITESKATVVLVAHRLSTVVNADCICVIDKGTVLEQGNHEELVAKKGGIYASMVEKQLKKKADLLDQDEPDKKKDSNKDGAVAADDIDTLLDEATSLK